LGPIPRICIDFVDDPSLLIDYEKNLQAMITDITSQSLRCFALDGGDINLGAESHAIFIMRRYEVDDLRRAYIEPVSAKVEMQLMTTINDLQRFERIDLYHTFASLNATKAVAGLVYKSLGHAHSGRYYTHHKANDKVVTEPRANSFPSEMPGRGAGVKFYGPGRLRDARTLSTRN
jgi:hypothetical protein